MKDNKRSLGRHMLLELYNCPEDVLDNQEKIEGWNRQIQGVCNKIIMNNHIDL